MSDFIQGPDQLLEADQLSTWAADGAVRLRGTTDDLLREPPISIPTLLANSAAKFSDHTAMAVKRDDRWVQWSYTEYYQQSRQVAKAFIKLGLEPFASVGILGFNAPEWLIAQMGAIMAGGFSVGIYTTNSSSLCKYIAENSKANIIVLEDSNQLAKILETRDELPHLKAIVQYQGQPVAPIPGVYSWAQLLDLGQEQEDSELEHRLKRIAVNQCCALIYTSGTTGLPKGVMMSHDNLTWTAKTAVRYLKVDMNDKLVSYLPLSHSAAQMIDVWMTMTAGASIYFADKNALKGSLVHTLKDVRPTIFFGVPRVYEKIAEKMVEVAKGASGFHKAVAQWAKKTGLSHNKKTLEGRVSSNGCSYPIAKKLVFSKVKANLGFDHTRILGVGAAPMPQETLEYFLSLDIPIFECYGMSETSGPQTGNRAGHHRLGSVGQSLDGCVTRVVDPDPEGNGEICMYSRNVMMGYLGSPEKTDEAIDKEGWLHSGDIGKEISDGYFKITGRIKELIITAGGENIPPVLIEDTIKKHLPCVSCAMVVGDRKKYLSCLLTLKVDLDLDTMEPLNTLAPATLDWCESRGIKARTVDELLRGNDKERATRALQDGIDSSNHEALSNAQKIQKWVVLPTDFSVPGGELGPTMKLKRHYVLKKYDTYIRNLYNV